MKDLTYTDRHLIGQCAQQINSTPYSVALDAGLRDHLIAEAEAKAERIIKIVREHDRSVAGKEQE